MTPEEYQQFSEANERLFNALERMIGYMYKRIPPDERMKQLRLDFPAASCIFEVTPFFLRKFGFSKNDALHFSTFMPFAQQYMEQRYGRRPRLNRVSIMADYLKGFFLAVDVECFYLVCLTQTGKLIKTKLMQKGDHNSAPFYFRDILQEAVTNEAKAIVLCHNHPHGTMKPSREDLLCTLRILQTFPSTGIVVLDHIIIAKGRAVSIRETGLIPEFLWKIQDEMSPLARKWLDKELLTE